MKWIPISASLFIMFAGPGYSEGTTVLVDNFTHEHLSPGVILDHWPICELSSSLGQTCRAFWEDEAPSGIYQVLNPDMSFGDTSPLNIEISGQTMSITVEDSWFYSFVISQMNDGVFRVIFTDDSLMGSYLAQTEYTVTIQDGAMIVTEGATQTW